MPSSTRPHTYSFTRYLSAKRTVDDRALNARIWQRMLRELARLTPHPVTLLEIGGGIGTMVDRLFAEPGLPPLHYHLLDAQADNIATAAARMGRRQPLTHDTAPDAAPFGLAPSASAICPGVEGQSHRVDLYAADLFDFLDAQPVLDQVQMVIANAFLDLVDLSTTLARLTRHFTPGTCFYFTINFDGSTIFEPSIDPVFDAHVEALYHRTMDERITNGQPSGDSHAGRHLFHAMQKAGMQVLDAGSSDWFVFPTAGRYPHDEAYFLHFIVHTMHAALIQHPDIDAARFTRWIEARHRQIEAGELIYIAHQLDYLGILQRDQKRQLDNNLDNQEKQIDG